MSNCINMFTKQFESKFVFVTCIGLFCYVNGESPDSTEGSHTTSHRATTEPELLPSWGKGRPKFTIDNEESIVDPDDLEPTKDWRKLEAEAAVKAEKMKWLNMSFGQPYVRVTTAEVVVDTNPPGSMFRLLKNATDEDQPEWGDLKRKFTIDRENAVEWEENEPTKDWLKLEAKARVKAHIMLKMGMTLTPPFVRSTTAEVVVDTNPPGSKYRLLREATDEELDWDLPTRKPKKIEDEPKNRKKREVIVEPTIYEGYKGPRPTSSVDGIVGNIQSKFSYKLMMRNEWKLQMERISKCTTATMAPTMVKASKSDKEYERLREWFYRIYEDSNFPLDKPSSDKSTREHLGGYVVKIDNMLSTSTSTTAPRSVIDYEELEIVDKKPYGIEQQQIYETVVDNHRIRMEALSSDNFTKERWEKMNPIIINAVENDKFYPVSQEHVHVQGDIKFITTASSPWPLSNQATRQNLERIIQKLDELCEVITTPRPVVDYNQMVNVYDKEMDNMYNKMIERHRGKATNMTRNNKSDMPYINKKLIMSELSAQVRQKRDTKGVKINSKRTDFKSSNKVSDHKTQLKRKIRVSNNSDPSNPELLVSNVESMTVTVNPYDRTVPYHEVLDRYYDEMLDYNDKMDEFYRQLHINQTTTPELDDSIWQTTEKVRIQKKSKQNVTRTIRKSRKKEARTSSSVRKRRDVYSYKVKSGHLGNSNVAAENKTTMNILLPEERHSFQNQTESYDRKNVALQQDIINEQQISVIDEIAVTELKEGSEGSSTCDQRLDYKCKKVMDSSCKTPRSVIQPWIRHVEEHGIYEWDSILPGRLKQEGPIVENNAANNNLSYHNISIIIKNLLEKQRKPLNAIHPVTNEYDKFKDDALYKKVVKLNKIYIRMLERVGFTTANWRKDLKQDTIGMENRSELVIIQTINQNSTTDICANEIKKIEFSGKIEDGSVSISTTAGLEMQNKTDFTQTYENRSRRNLCEAAEKEDVRHKRETYMDANPLWKTWQSIEKAENESETERDIRVLSEADEEYARNASLHRDINPLQSTWDSIEEEEKSGINLGDMSFLNENSDLEKDGRAKKSQSVEAHEGRTNKPKRRKKKVKKEKS